jgi:hypothetical protein
MRRKLCGLSDIQPNRKSRLKGHFDQGVQAELGDFSAQKIVQARLGDAKSMRRLSLG